METQAVEQLTFGFLPQIPVVVQRSEGQLTSDAGLLPLAEFDRRWGYTARMSACLGPLPTEARPEGWRGSLPQHQRLEMLRQRLFGIIAGYEDCNDHDTLRSEPVFKLIADRLPEDDDLASQPTLSRFENSVRVEDLFALNDFLIATGIETLKRQHGGRLPDELTIDLDATDDPTHGQQQLSLFHGYFEQYQYFPSVVSEPTSKHIFGVWLRPGTMHAALGADDDLMRVVKALRNERPDIRLHVRGDAGFGVPWMYEVCEKNSLSYTFGFSTNSRLKALTEGLMNQAVGQYQNTGQKQRLFACFDYQADSWEHPRKVIAKAECHAQGTNLRFVVSTRMPIQTAEDAQREYDHYVQRGESEQRMDELKNGLKMDRLSCHRFMANFFRLLVHTAALNLLNAMRQGQDLPEVLRVGQPCTWRMMLIKVAAVVVQRTRRVIVKLAANWPWWEMYRSAGRRVLSFEAGP
jgi:hypothetical protein